MRPFPSHHAEALIASDVRCAARIATEKLALAVLVWGATLLALVTVETSSARADGVASSLSLEWAAPVECSDADYVRGEIRRILSSAQSSFADTRVAATASVSHTEGVWRVDMTIEVEGSIGHRRFFGDSCRSVQDATALMLALTVNPHKVAAYRAGITPREPPPSQG